jgi:hypothetical protein
MTGSTSSGHGPNLDRRVGANKRHPNNVRCCQCACAPPANANVYSRRSRASIQLLLGPLADVRGSEGLDRPMIILAPDDQGADANDRMVDVLRKLISDRSADLIVSLAGQPVRGREAAEVGHGLKVPDDDATVHGLKRLSAPVYFDRV